MTPKPLLQLRTLFAGIFYLKTYINLWKFDFVIYRDQQNVFDDDYNSRPDSYYNRAFIENNAKDGSNNLKKKNESKNLPIEHLKRTWQFSR